jgi:hypothetical protein
VVRQRHPLDRASDDMSMDEQRPIPHDPTDLALARAIGAQLRLPPRDEVRTQHVRRAAAAVGDATGDAVAGAAGRTVGDRAPADVLTAIIGPARAGRRRAARRFVPVSALALLAVVALVTTFTQPSQDLPVIALGGGGGGAPMAAADAPMSREAGPATDAPISDMMWIAVDYEFILEDGARVAAGTGPAWRFVAPADPAVLAARLTSRFGLPTAGPAEWDAATLISQTPDGASLTLTPDGSWYFSAAPDPRLAWRCPEYVPDAAPRAGEANVPLDFECQPPPPAVGVPSTVEADALATALFADLGITGIRFQDTYVDDWSANVWGLIGVDGAPRDVGQHFGAGFGADGELRYANGTFARPVRLGDYPTVDSEVALERLRAQLGADAGGPVARPYPADVPSELPAERERVTVRLVAAEVVEQYAWTREGEMVIVPHYRFRDSDGGEWWVIAIAERYLEG